MSSKFKEVIMDTDIVDFEDILPYGAELLFEGRLGGNVLLFNEP
jgi:hypothetical protein